MADSERNVELDQVAKRQALGSDTGQQQPFCVPAPSGDPGGRSPLDQVSDAEAHCRAVSAPVGGLIQPSRA